MKKKRYVNAMQDCSFSMIAFWGKLHNYMYENSDSKAFPIMPPAELNGKIEHKISTRATDPLKIISIRGSRRSIYPVLNWRETKESK